jgi:prepilin-type processing-associated H-X9-DG protein
MKTCQNCGKQIETDANRCDHCGAEMKPELSAYNTKKRTEKLAIVGILLFPLVLVLYLLGEAMCNEPLPILLAAPVFGVIISVLYLLGEAMCNEPLPILLAAPVFGVIISVLALRSIKASAKRLRGKTLSVIGIFLNIAFLGLMALPLLATNVRRTPHPPACVNHLKHLGLIMAMYCNENDDRFPPVDDRKNNFIFDATLLYPEYLTDHLIAHCPQHLDFAPNKNFRLISTHPTDGTRKGKVHPDCFTADSYIYLGWMVTSDEEAEAFFAAYDKLSSEDYHGDITVPEGKGNSGGNVIHRLTADVDRFLLTDMNISLTNTETPASTVPIIWDRPYTDPMKLSHRFDNESGGNVLYLDGHVDYIKFGEKFPMTETMARLLEERPWEPIPYCEERQE